MEQTGELVLRVIQSADPAIAVGRQFPVGSGGIIGRGAAAAICLPGSTVSRRHASLARRDGAWRITPLTTSNATFVGGEALSGPAALQPGDQVQLGGVLLLLAADPGTTPVLAPLAARVLLEVRDDGGVPAVYLDGSLLALAPQPARALACLAAAPGVPVHRWDMLEVVGAQANLDKCISQVRLALRREVAARSGLAAALASAAGQPPGDAAALVRAVVATRRGHGYVLQLPARLVRVVDT